MPAAAAVPGRAGGGQDERSSQNDGPTGSMKLFTRDHEPRNLLQRPRDAPVRTAFGVYAITFYLVLMVSGANDFLASMFGIPFEWLVWSGRIGVLVLPVVAAVVSHRICAGLRRGDRDVPPGDDGQESPEGEQDQREH